MQLVPLNVQHAEQLLEFERINRDWFELHIDPREEDFYSLTGVQTHIAELVMDQILGKALPTLVVDHHGVIIGRVNLHNIADDKAFLGYRLGQQFVGKGLAKQAVALMLPQARAHKVTTLIAIASTENIASQKVLLSQGFTPSRELSNFAQVQGRAIDCIEYRLTLS